MLHSPFNHPWRLPGVRSPMAEAQSPSTRTRVVREPDRAVYDRDTVYRILDAGFICHVGFAVDGQPLPPRLGRQSHAEADEEWGGSVRYRHPAGRTRTRPLRLQSLDELPVGG